MATPEPPDHVLVVKDAIKAFRGKAVLGAVSLTVSQGEVLGVVGPNGGGKSTLLMLCAGLLRPTAGTVDVCGITAHKLALTTAGLIGLVTARPGLYPLLTGRENLHHFGGLFGLSAQQVDAKAEELVQAFTIQTCLGKRVSHCSTGMQQKLSLVRALLLSPKLLLFDEPTANVDPVASQLLYQELRKRADSAMACMLVTHDLASAEAVCDRVILLDHEIKRHITFDQRVALPQGPLLSAWQEEITPR